MASTNIGTQTGTSSQTLQGGQGLLNQPQQQQQKLSTQQGLGTSTLQQGAQQIGQSALSSQLPQGQQQQFGTSSLQGGQQQFGTSSLQGGQQQFGQQQYGTSSLQGGQQQYGGQGLGQKVLYEQREFPPVVQETILPKERREMQNIIHREVIIPEVHRVTQPYFERQVRPEVIQQRELPPVFHEIPRGQQQIPQRQVPPSKTEMAPVETQVVEKPPIVVERVRKVITQEIQPIIYREVIEPQVQRELRPMSEQVQKPVQTREMPFQPQWHHIHSHPQQGVYQQPLMYPTSGQSPWWNPMGWQHHHQQQQFGGWPQQQQQQFAPSSSSSSSSLQSGQQFAPTNPFSQKY